MPGRGRGGPVSRVLFRVFPEGDAAMTISLGRRSPGVSGSRPGSGTERAVPCQPLGWAPSCLALLPMGFTEPDRSPDPLVSSYLTVSPLPAGGPAGGLFSVALSLTLRPVGVTHHRALWSPDFPPAGAFPTGIPRGSPTDSPDRRSSDPPRSLSRKSSRPSYSIRRRGF